MWRLQSSTCYERSSFCSLFASERDEVARSAATRAARKVSDAVASGCAFFLRALRSSVVDAFGCCGPNAREPTRHPQKESESEEEEEHTSHCSRHL